MINKVRENIKMDGYLIRYSSQLGMLYKLLKSKLITNEEYSKIEKTLMKDYKILSNLTAK